MKIHWMRILIAAILAEILIFSIYILALQYAGSALKVIAFLDFFGLMFLGGLWVAHKIESHFLLHGILVGIVASVLYIVCCLPWILDGQLAFDYGLGAFQSSAIKIPASAAGSYLGGILKKNLNRGRHGR